MCAEKCNRAIAPAQVGVGGGGGRERAVSAHPTREEITPHKHVGEMSEIFLLCTLQISPTVGALPPAGLQLPASAPAAARRAGSRSPRCTRLLHRGYQL